MYRSLESLAGNGKLFDGDRCLGRVTYQVQTSQKMLDAGRGELIPGLGRIEGVIIGGDVDLFDVVTRNAEVTLELEDGRCWDCLVQSTGGNLVNRGQGFYTR
jgi:hypothetical protein